MAKPGGPTKIRRGPRSTAVSITVWSMNGGPLPHSFIAKIEQLVEEEVKSVEGVRVLMDRTVY